MLTEVRSRNIRREPLPTRLRATLFPEGSASLWRYVALIFVILLAVLSLFPFYWALITSFKAPQDVATVPPSLVLTRPAITNYIDLIRGTGVANAPVVRWFLNSVLTSIAATAGVVLLASLAGYSFARKQFPFRDQIFWLIIATILVPGWSTIIATYVLTLNLGMHDTYWALILPGLASPFAVFLFRQFAVTLPEELFQAARIDGAGELQLWWLIALPMSRPVLATLAIFTFVAHWNDFLWPLLVLNKQTLYTLPVGVSVIMYQIQGAGPSYGIGMAAAILMSVLPILAFILMQRQMIEGITIGSLKG
ncbi:MAG TPA: carbohydrate ABC transporter permease [Caldilineaceae bacterium]|mgnify:CR=1 FL=1|nr:carbohydrate ABC transporter permease [Caldilineaceae bacterium]